MSSNLPKTLADCKSFANVFHTFLLLVVQSLYLTRQLSDGDKPTAPPAKAETLETWIVRAHCDKGSLQVTLAEIDCLRHTAHDCQQNTAVSTA